LTASHCLPHRQADQAFAEAWEDAMEAGVDRAEQEAFRRGVHGFEEPVIYQGILSTTVLRDAKLASQCSTRWARWCACP
jgi:hypothetical protein